MIDAALTRRLWSELHTFAKLEKSDLDQISFVSNWLRDSESAIDCQSCWWKVTRFCQLWPVEYGKGLWLWSICLHDYVNKELGRSLFYPSLTLAPLFAKGIIH